MSAKALFQSQCPACGAPVALASSASAFVVCSYCHSSLSRQGDALQAMGVKSEVLEDYSPLQLGAGGRFEGQGFTVVGRIQMAYDGGFWNEWHVLYGDGSTGWLSDASGHYAMLRARAVKQPPAFDRLTPGRGALIDDQPALVADKREARCVGAQGELPFAVGERWTARVVDLRMKRQLLTLDYSEAQPVLYAGTSVTLEQLQMQLLRDEQAINDSAGRLKGKLQALTCANCGSTVKAVAGTTHIAKCASCGSTLDVNGKTAQLIEKGRQAEARTRDAFLEAGDIGVLKGVSWTVLGVIEQVSRTADGTYRWTDYLLFNARHGLRWLSQSADHQWQYVEVLDEWPTRQSATEVQLRSAHFRLEDTYTSEVERVWGSFNWRVNAGDKTHCQEYESVQGSPDVPRGSLLVCETTPQEQTWSLCVPLERQAVASAFGKKLKAPGPSSRAMPEPASPSRHAQRYASTDTAGDTADGVMTFALIAHGLLWLSEPSMFGLFLGGATLVAIWMLKPGRS